MIRIWKCGSVDGWRHSTSTPPSIQTSIPERSLRSSYKGSMQRGNLNLWRQPHPPNTKSHAPARGRAWLSRARQGPTGGVPAAACANHSTATLLRRHGQVVPIEACLPKKRDTYPYRSGRPVVGLEGPLVVECGVRSAELGIRSMKVIRDRSPHSTLHIPQSTFRTRISPSFCGGRPACRCPRRRGGSARRGPLAR